MTTEPIITTHRLARRWPYRILNLLSPAFQLKFLTWKSGGPESNTLFDLRRNLISSRRILIAAPGDFQELVISLPLLQAYQHNLPGKELYLLAEVGQASFLKAIFSPEQLIFYDNEEIYIGEPALDLLTGQIRDLGLDIIFNLKRNSSPLLQLVLKASLAPLRIDIFRPESWPFANIRFLPGDPPNLLRTQMLAAKVWYYAGIPLQGSGRVLRSDRGALDKAVAQIRSLGIDPEETALFLWQDQPLERQLDLLKQVIAGKGGKDGYRSVLIVHGEAAPFFLPELPVDASSMAPSLAITGVGQFLAVAASVAVNIGTHGILLHLASLCDKPVQAFFRKEEAFYDTSFLRPRMRVAYLE